MLLCVGLFALSASISYSQQVAEVGPYLKGKLVDIGGGRRLNLVCLGKGSPTVVFLQGLGGGITAWRNVRDPIASITRTCFYDRAGFGFSDPSSQPATASNSTDDLHTLLHGAGIRGVVLVGHSLGGLFATLYTDRHPAEVKGLVLVDPSFANQFDYAIPDAKRLMLSDENQFLVFLKGCQTLAKEGKLSRAENHNCFRISSNATKEEADYLLRQGINPGYYASGISEVENFFPLAGPSIDGLEELEQRRSFNDMPLIVLSAGSRARDARLSLAQNDEMQNFLRSGHEALSVRSTRGELIVVPQSGHDVQADQPQAVVDAIRKVVLSLRQ